jgi:hypothetical protein
MQALRSNVTLSCPICGQTGFAVWEEREDAPRQLIHVSRGFHPEIGRPDEPLIVCNACDHFQSGPKR